MTCPICTDYARLPDEWDEEHHPNCPRAEGNKVYTDHRVWRDLLHDLEFAFASLATLFEKGSYQGSIARLASFGARERIAVITASVEQALEFARDEGRKQERRRT